MKIGFGPEFVGWRGIQDHALHRAMRAQADSEDTDDRDFFPVLHE
ncbi:MAG TPA: hypothetical protein VGN97_06375 [Mesorhizobium sp.]|jgi:hypothetical protein|nr:hypothetical protein [Mesorhizobium sp.]